MNNTTDNFFGSEDYKIPDTSNYMKFIEGDNVFRALSSAIVGFVYFNTDNKPVRSKEVPESVPSDIQKDGNIKHFWAFIVWNENAKRVQLLEITQKSIMTTMQAYIKNAKWGSPKKYDFIVSKKGSGFDTEYAISVNPKAPLDESIAKKYLGMKINLDALFEGLDPFTAGLDPFKADHDPFTADKE